METWFVCWISTGSTSQWTVWEYWYGPVDSECIWPYYSLSRVKSFSSICPGTGIYFHQLLSFYFQLIKLSNLALSHLDFDDYYLTLSIFLVTCDEIMFELLILIGIRCSYGSFCFPWKLKLPKCTWGIQAVIFVISWLFQVLTWISRCIRL